jgi:DNA-binding beta-propeller fold protein YncE
MMHQRRPFPSRSSLAQALLLMSALVSLPGCWSERPLPDRVWGRKGVQNGDMVRPRAIAIDRNDRLYIVDYTARIQVFDRDGNYLGPTWTTPDYRKGRPSGLGIDRDGNLLVCDSHYSCVRVYTPEGKELLDRRMGGVSGPVPGQLGYVSDVVQDKDGYYYLTEYGSDDNQRITKLDPQGRFVKCWGRMGTEPGELARARALALGPDGNLYVADSCNHRIQVFDRDGKLVRLWGETGTEPGQLSYPYDLAFNAAGVLYVVEYGNHRVQKFTSEGKSLGCWGSGGREPGCFHCPWGLAIDSLGYIHVVDTENHRVQRLKF